MIKGMTGFGSCEFSWGKVKGAIEIRSLNHRFLDISFYLPAGFAQTENKIRQIISEAISRGKVTVSVKILQRAPMTVVFNRTIISQYVKYAKELKKEFGFNNDLTLSDLAKLPGVVEAKESTVEVDDLWLSAEESLRRCLKSLVLMRQREGRSLAQDLRDKLRKMSGLIGKINKRAKEILKAKKGSLTNEEFSSLQKSNDVNEETSRLLHYVEEMKLLLKSDLPIGKKIDFIAQEMQRETNTIGSKLQDKLISNAVISLKSKIEKIREQGQNIE